jgi:hypothetical protein
MLDDMRNGMRAARLGAMAWLACSALGFTSAASAQGPANPTLPAPAAEPAPPAAPAPAAVPQPAAATSSPAGQAAAGPVRGVVHLRNGGFVRGELIELQPGVLVRVKLADGTVRELAWSEVDHIDDPALPPPAPRAESAPTLPAAAAGAAAATAPGPTPEETNAAEIARLRAERDEINNNGPTWMMILGGGAFLLLGTPGMVMLACDRPSYDGSFDDCEDSRGAGIALTAVGVVGGAVAVWGLIKASKNRQKRRALNNRILELKGEKQIGLSVDVVPRAHGASVGLTLRM